MTDGRAQWVDLLEDRRKSSDILWLAFHKWDAENYKFSLGRSAAEIREAVYADPAIEVLIKSSSRARDKIDAILEEMAHSWSLRSIRLLGFFVTKVMKSIYRNVWVMDHLAFPRGSFYEHSIAGSSLRDKINAISLESPIIYMPTHRSYADFLIFAYVCFAMNLPLPAIAAGIDFLSLNQVASMLRACGAFFIRRSFKQDSLYWETFRAYVQTQLTGGERPIEFFIEGTRSRSGKSISPKTGLLGVAVELFLSGKIPDLVVLPVSIAYDRTLEEELYAKELVPAKLLHDGGAGSKPKETTQHLISGAKAILAQDFGSVFIRFGEPMSIRELSYSFRGTDLRQAALRDSQHTAEFVSSVAKSIVCEQVRSLVLSPFTFFSVIALSGQVSELPKATVKKSTDSRSIRFSLAPLLEDIDSLCSLVPPKNVSHIVMNESIEFAFMESVKVHKALACFADSQICVVSDPLLLLQIRHYANQAMQLLIDTAICCYTDCFETFVRIKYLLEREFIFVEDSLEADFKSAQERTTTPRAKAFLVANLRFYLNAYLSLVIWLKSFVVPQSLQLKALVREAQKEVDLSSDVIENGLQLLISRDVLVRENSSLTVDANNLQLIYQEIFSLAFPEHSSALSFKSKL